ncbi:MAG: TraB/GumN family protein [Paludibacteraceae bacterium]|nr:TraB/GumN family protein [Paludibacteraceae bacterium]
MKKIILFGYFLMLSSIAHAQLLWEISGNQLKEKSYLFGTHHLIPISFLDSIKGIYPAFNSCENIVGEIIMDDPSIIKNLQQAAIITSGETIKDLLTEEQYTTADSILKDALGVGLNEMRFFKPAMIENIYLLTIYDKYFQIDADFQIDTYFQKVGKKDGKRLFSLETVDEQIKILLDRKPLREQAQSLYEMLTSSEKIINQLEVLNRLYLKQDLEELLEYSNNDSMQTPEDKWILLDQRNIRWAEQLPKQFEKGSNFIVVGALHLPGENGVINLLKKQGYKIKPVK